MEPPPSPIFRQKMVPHLASVGLVVGLYAMSFFLPVTRGFINLRGWEAILVVAGALFTPSIPTRGVDDADWILTFLGYLPNPLVWIGIVLLVLGQWRLAAVAGAIALAFGIIWMFDVGGGKLDVSHSHVGYYCWLASMAALAAAGMTIDRLRSAGVDGYRGWQAGTGLTLAVLAGMAILSTVATCILVYVAPRLEK